VIFGQGFLPLALDKSISNCLAAVLVSVHTDYFISPVPTISGERSPVRHLGRRPMGQRIPKLIMDWIKRERRKRGRPKKTWTEGVQAVMTTRNLEPDQWRGMAFGFRKKATAVKKPGR